MEANDRSTELTPNGNGQGAAGAEPSWLVQNAGTLFWAVATVAGSILLFGWPTMLNFAIVMLGLGLVIFIHELGHFAVAKWCDVYVETFSIGFGPALPGCRWQRGETTYMIALFPLGGYVKMLGEGPEDDEDADNPRAFKNKPVWQRMAIISAGVINNVILGCLCFIFVFMAHGDKQVPGILGAIDGGSPAWEHGMRSGDVIYQLNDKKDPSFNVLKEVVPLSVAGHPIHLKFGPPGGPVRESSFEPRKLPDDSYPNMGVGGPSAAKLPPARAKSERAHPVYYNSAAERAVPPFEFGDVLEGTTDPDRPATIAPLPDDPRALPVQQPDCFVLWERQSRLAGKDMVFRVRRASGATVDCRVPPAYQRTLGLRMQMGRVTAVLATNGNRPHPIKAKDPNKPEGTGDRLKAVEVQDVGGVKLRWALEPAPPTPASVASLVILGVNPLGMVVAGLPTQGIEKQLDPVRLPFELQQWADRQKTDRKVRVIVERAVGNRENTPVSIELVWDDSYRFDNVHPISRNSPVALTGLGIAYEVRTTIEAVEPDSPAAKARTARGEALQKGDIITAVRFAEVQRDKSPEPLLQTIWQHGLQSFVKVEPKPMKLEENQWPHAFWNLQRNESKQLTLTVQRSGAEKFDLVLDAREDPSWPVVDRGLLLMGDMRLKKSESLGAAMSLGFEKTFNFIQQVFKMIRGLATRRLALDTTGGPIMIFSVGMGLVDDVFVFIYFLGMISINLAVINFLPIPVLDGGHFVFLVYEGLRGRPAPERLRIGATYVGLGLILSLMVFVCVMDVQRLSWWPW